MFDILSDIPYINTLKEINGGSDATPPWQQRVSAYSNRLPDLFINNSG